MSDIDRGMAFKVKTILLLEHRYRYYIQDAPTISDYEYDMLEKDWKYSGEAAGIDTDNLPNMVGFDYKNRYAQAAIRNVNMVFNGDSKAV